MEIEIEGKTIPLDRRESSRAKRMKLRYRKDRIELVIPENADADVERFLEEKKSWLLDKAEEVEKYMERMPDHDIRENGSLNVLGDQKSIKVEKRRSGAVEDDIFLAEHLAERNSLREQLEKRLREHARERIMEKIKEYIHEIDGEYNKVFIRDQDTRWGSCSSRNNLNFNWRLILGPEHVMEYVVVHELVHLEIDNHGPRFEARIDELFDEREQSEKWLQENEALLEF